MPTGARLCFTSSCGIAVVPPYCGALAGCLCGSFRKKSWSFRGVGGRKISPSKPGGSDDG